MPSESRRSDPLRIVTCVILAALITFILQVLPFSVRRVLIGSGVLTGPEVAALEVLAGTVNSLIVTAVCLIALRRPRLWLAIAAFAVQVFAVELAYRFRQGGDTINEVLLRYTEHVGILIGATFALWLYKSIAARRHTSSAPN
jgi:hypothetical protein